MRAGRATAERLLGAIDELVARESIWLGAGNYAQAAAVSRRVAPLIARLYQLSVAEGGIRPALAPRVSALLSQRRENHASLASGRAFVAAESRRIAEARRRLLDLAPVYGRVRSGPPRTSRLNAAV